MPLELVDVRTNNLRGLTLAIDPLSITVVCGVSGSGKSSLVFDTIHAEAQRRYLETFSPRVRELFARLPRPDAERIDGVPPTIALPQDSGPAPPAATLGGETGLVELLAELFASAASFRCPECGESMVASDAESLADRIGSRSAGDRLMIGFPVDDAPAGAWSLLADARFVRGMVDGVPLRLDQPLPPDAIRVDGIADRVVVGRTERSRMIESLQLASRAGRGRVLLFAADGGRWTSEPFVDELACPQGHVAGERPDAARFVASTGDDETAAGRIAAVAILGERQFGRLSCAAIADVWEWANEIDPSERLRAALLPELRRRLQELVRLALAERTLAVPIASLSHGERQRMRLASIVAADSVGSLIILDEPTAGLAEAEAAGVFEAVADLHRQGNGVLLVEHRLEAIGIGSRVIELGPGAGTEGGEVIFDGLPHELRESDTPTARALRGVPQPVARDAVPAADLTVAFASAPIAFPRDRLTVVATTGGRGPSDLIAAAARGDSVAGDGIEDVIVLDQSPVSQSPRSCLATATKVLDEIRALFAAVPEAKARGMTVRHFSFNAPGGGRCPQCQGRGTVQVAMAHLSDLPMDCPRCGGTRYAADVLQIKHRRRTVADVLAMTVDEALAFFRTEVSIHRRLQPVKDVGLGYLTLGRSLTTLSGGESQRLRLATHLTASTRGRVLFLLDEPSRGLHPQDAAVLADSLRRLLEVGHTVLAADHSWTLLAAADWAIELAAGEVAFAGPPVDLLEAATPLADSWRRAIEAS